jgi:uncharacterized membrane protein
MRRFAACKAFGLVALCVWALSSSSGCGGSDEGEPPAGPVGSVSWCQVREVLGAKCQRCHVGAGLHGAPFPLVTYDDTQVYLASLEKHRWQLMANMVEQDQMPPEDSQLEPPPAKLTASEKDVLMTWFAEGALLVGGEHCD